MQQIQLRPEAQEIFTRAALQLRWDDGEAPVDARQLNQARRNDDRGADLWRTFNRTQDDPNLVLVKSSAAANCVVPKTTAATALSISNSQNNPFALLGVCSGAFGAASDGVSVNLNGKELPNAPHFTVSLGAQYTFEMDNGWAAVARADYYHQTESFARIYNSVPDQIEAWSNVNLTLSFANADNGWSVDGFVKNATDEEAITDTYLTDDSSGLFRNAFYTEPRTFGVAVSKSW
jgi:outer membrane receptor protein involved in Fe transport